jgi:hypothetical protein
MTFFVQVKQGSGETGPTPDEWHPWKNCGTDETNEDKPDETTLGMIIHRYLRNRGGVRPDERHAFTVFSYSEKTPCYPINRQTCRCYTGTFVAGKGAS